MSILSRFGTIMKSNINAALDKMEDPAKMVDQYIIDLNKDLAAVKKETAGVMGQEKNAHRILMELQEEVKRFNNLAEQALLSGSDEDAMVFLGKKQELDGRVAEAEAVWAAAHDNANKMRTLYNKLCADIQNLEQRRSTIKAKAAIAKTQTRVADATAKTRGGSAGFDRLEARVNQQFDQAAALMELSEEVGCDAEDLAKKYKAGANPATVNNELAAMKARLGLAGQAE